MKYLFILSLLLIAACGVKPTKLDAPAGSDPSQFPRSYPAP